MHRAPALAAALLALSACRVAETPDEYLNPRNPAHVERREAENEVAARVGAFREALARGGYDAAVQALAPAADTHVMGTSANDGRSGIGPQALASALQELRLPPGSVARTPDLRVEADAREGQAWFATHVEVLPVVGTGGEPATVRVSGVFMRREGDWRLVQVHLSRADETAAADSAAADSSAADSVAVRTADSPPRRSPASGAAPPEDE